MGRYGAIWTLISDGLPYEPLDCVCELILRDEIQVSARPSVVAALAVEGLSPVDSVVLLCLLVTGFNPGLGLIM